ncbi:MAG: hypothetical protein NTV55_08460 [Planctomycetota bacterium]|nr:hypothetical protein [Planctomycetota bacterium]
MTSLLCFLALVVAGQPLRVGIASVDITQNPATEKVWMAGFSKGRQARSVHDNLAVRACVLEHGGKKLAFACADLIGLFDEQVRSAEARLAGFETIISVTHNHHGPDTLGLWGPGLSTGIDSGYLKRVEDAIVQAVRDAAAGAVAVTAHIGQVDALDLLKDSRPPQVKMAEITVLRFDAMADGKKPAGLFVLWHNHPEFVSSSTTAITADFVGPVVDRLAKKYACPVFYATGAIGGLMSPIGLDVTATDAKDGKAHKSGSFGALEVYGAKIAQRAEAAVSSAQPVRLSPWTLRQRDVYLPVDNMIYRLGHQLGVLKRAMHLWSGDTTRVATVAEGAGSGKRAAVRTRAGVLTLGEVQIALVPGEIYPELVLGQVPEPAPGGADFPEAAVEPSLLSQLTARHKLVIGLAQDEIGYILPKRQWDAKAPWTYGRTSAPYGEINSLGPDTAPLLLPLYKDLAR